MGTSDSKPATQILLRVQDGADPALEQLFALVYEQLRDLASVLLRRERSDHTLEPTALVHEAYLRLVDQTTIAWQDATHFRAVAGRAMRQVLVDHARRHGAAKRGGGWLKFSVHDSIGISGQSTLELLALDEAMAKLAERDERKSRIVELLFFGGLTHAEAARVLGISPKTVEADWYFARAWLGRELDAAG